MQRTFSYFVYLFAVCMCVCVCDNLLDVYLHMCDVMGMLAVWSTNTLGLVTCFDILHIIISQYQVKI